MKKITILITILILVCCNQSKENKIILSDTLEIALKNKNKYFEYVNLLNLASLRDTSALYLFFKIDYICNAAGYDHGYILSQLVATTGDKISAEVISKMNSTELNNFQQYIEADIDNSKHSLLEFKQKFPLLSRLLFR
jgi:hypothetical protein